MSAEIKKFLFNNLQVLKLQNIKIESGLVLAPMAGISDLPFRLLNRKFGAEMAFVEMVNCRSLSHKSRRTREMLRSNVNDRPLGVQILGCEEKFILRALDVLRNYNFDILDFNAACPAKKIVRRGEGASLLKDPEKLERILKFVVKNSAWPVTAKIRIGWDKYSVNACEVARIAEGVGVCALFVHGRTKEQGYSGNVDYKAIKKVRDAVKIPIVSSGDILSAELAKKMFNETGCDGLAIARGSLGNPWIFQQINEFLKFGKVRTVPDGQEICKMMRAHLKLSISYYGERTGVMLFRKFFAWYTKGFRKIRPLREKSSRAKTAADMEEIISLCPK